MRGVPEDMARLLDKPWVRFEGVSGIPLCSVCLKPAANMHHVVLKGAGGVPVALDARIPRVALCGVGNASGCHGLAHARKLHFDWRDGGWAYLITRIPTRRADALPMDGWRRLAGWELARMSGTA